MKKLAIVLLGAVMIAGCDRQNTEDPKPQVVGVSSRPAYASSTPPPPETAPATQAGVQPDGPPMPPTAVVAKGGKLNFKEAMAAATASEVPEVTTTTGLKYKDMKAGTGAEATKGKRAYVQYTGWLKDGREFDSSYKRGIPFDFVLGRGAVIAGWDEGVVGMKVGGRRLLTIPAHLGYGSAGTTGIPGGAVLIFDVELVDVK